MRTTVTIDELYAKALDMADPHMDKASFARANACRHRNATAIPADQPG